MSDRNPDNGRKWRDSCAIVSVFFISGATFVGTAIGWRVS